MLDDIPLSPDPRFQNPSIIDEDALESRDDDEMLLAQKYMEARQYTRAVHVLRNCVSAKAVFISAYCRFLVRRMILQEVLDV